MKNYNPDLTYLIVQEYVAILYRLLKHKLITAEQMSIETGRYMRKVGFSKPILILTVCAYLALL